MRQLDFDELLESVRQAGKIKRGETAGAQNPEDASDGRIALERLEEPEGWYSLEDIEEGRDRRDEESS